VAAIPDEPPPPSLDDFDSLVLAPMPDLCYLKAWTSRIFDERTRLAGTMTYGL